MVWGNFAANRNPPGVRWTHDAGDGRRREPVERGVHLDDREKTRVVVELVRDPSLGVDPSAPLGVVPATRAEEDVAHGSFRGGRPTTG